MMQLRVIDPPTMDKPLTKNDAVAAVRHSFAVVRARGQAIVHRNQLNNTIDAWLLANGFLSPASSEQGEGNQSLLDEVLGTGDSSTVSFVRAGLLLKAGPWYCPHPARALLLSDAGTRTVAILSPLPADFLARGQSHQTSTRLEEAGLAYIATFDGATCPWPIADLFQLIDLKPVDATATTRAAAISLISTGLAPEVASGTATFVGGETDLTRLPQSVMNQRIQVRSVGRWDLISNVGSRPPPLWGGVEIRPDVYAFMGRSTYDESNPGSEVLRKVVVLMTPRQGRAASSPRITQLRIEPFLAGRVEWAFRAALGDPVLVGARIEGEWVVLDFQGVVPTGPLRTWLALFGLPTSTSGVGEEWKIRREAEAMTSAVLAQYFAKMRRTPT
jgi:hypothetical protein